MNFNIDIVVWKLEGPRQMFWGSGFPRIMLAVM